ncbi:MAG: hypothetical protein JWP97_486 [Labilithrix sp.]|nr:hypothetical protein [Labilithrix sp.]
MRSTFLALALATVAAFSTTLLGCSSDDGSVASGDEQDVTSNAATLKLTADQKTELLGEPTAGKGLAVEYALERLSQCRGNVGGGGPAWNVTGYYSENGSPAKTFEVSKLSADGKDRIAKPGRIVPSEGGDLAIWFQVSSGFGCSGYDSSFGQNYHLTVKGQAPDAAASITFDKSGAPTQTGELKAGSKVKVRYEQDRLPECRRTQAGYPQWSISGFSQIDKEPTHSFDTAVASSGDRQEVDAFIELPHAGKLSLWFQVVDVGGCNEFDSNAGANYEFSIGE